MVQIVLDFLTKYFAVLSAAAIAAGSSIVIIFIYGYLGVFDWNLIWIIEYQDITKFTLITIALGITAYQFLGGLGTIIYNLGKMDANTNKRFAIGGIGVLIAFAALSLWFGYHNDRPSLEYYVYLWLSIFFTVGLLAAWIRIIPDWTTKTRLQQAQMIGGMLIFVVVLGKTFGLYVKDISKNQQDVYTNGETLTDQKIIILLSHHSIFYKNGIVTVLQSSDIKKIALKPSP
jgi:hypothetical protein